jgi:hypothetical protein
MIKVWQRFVAARAAFVNPARIERLPVRVRTVWDLGSEGTLGALPWASGWIESLSVFGASSRGCRFTLERLGLTGTGPRIVYDTNIPTTPFHWEAADPHGWPFVPSRCWIRWSTSREVDRVVMTTVNLVAGHAEGARQVAFDVWDEGREPER